MAFEEELGMTEEELKSDKKRAGYTRLIQMVFGFFTSRIGAYISLILMLVIYGLVQGLVITFMVGTDDLLLSALLAADPLSFILNVYELGQVGTDLASLALPIAVGAILMLLGFIISVMVIGAAVKFTLDRYDGRETTVGQSIASAMGRIATLFMVQLIVSAVTGILLRPLNTIGYLMNTTEDLDYLTELAGVSLVILIPILFSYTLLLVSVVAVMDTGDGPFSSIWRSVSSTSRNLLYSILSVLVFLTVLFILQFVIEFGLILLLGEYGFLVSAFIYQILALPLIYIFQTTFYRQLEATPEKKEPRDLW